MSLSFGATCVKYLMCIFNLIFVVTGIIILTVGAVIQAKYYDYNVFVDGGFYATPALLIATGTIILIISFFGCCGAYKENYCMTVTFVTFLVLIFVLELAAGIAGYMLRDRAHDVVASQLNQTMYKYGTDKEITDMWDDVQTELSCCGPDNSTEWRNVFQNESLPYSCCTSDVNVITNCNTNSTNIHQEGCINKLGAVVSKHAAILGGVAIGFALIQLIGIIFACNLAGSIRRNYETV